MEFTEEQIKDTAAAFEAALRGHTEFEYFNFTLGWTKTYTVDARHPHRIKCTIPEGFLAWTPETVVNSDDHIEAIRRDGYRVSNLAKNLKWTHVNNDYDIIAYRVVTIAKPTKQYVDWTFETAPVTAVRVKHCAARTKIGAVLFMPMAVEVKWSGDTSSYYSYSSLHILYTQLDGTPCGTEVK
jgi:hypothetical protein